MENQVAGVPHSVRLFEESEDATRDARQLAERDRDYVNNKQLTSEEEATLNKRGQPSVVYNLIAPKVNFLLGLEQQQRKDPKCFPRTPGDDAAAHAATDALRYVCDDARWDMKRSSAARNIFVEGTGAIMVGAQKGKEGIDPDLIFVPWDRLFADPYSSHHNFSDATYMGIVTWMDEKEAKQKFKGKDEIIEATIDSVRATDTYDDKPKWQIWADYKRRRIRVIETFYITDGVWHWCIATQSGELVEAQPSPYLDDDGKPENPIKAVSLYVDRDNNRYGEVRGMISPQDEVNKRKSKGLHLITMRQSRISRGAALNKAEVSAELAKPDGVIVADDGDFEVLETNDMARGNFEMYLDAKTVISSLGPNVSLQGKNENDLSGRALNAMQQGGMVEVANLMDAIRELSLEVYRSIWARIRQYWDGPRWIRVTDDERDLKFVGLNQPLTVAQLAQQVQQGDKDALETARKLLPQGMLDAALGGDERAGAAVGLFIRDHGQQVVKVQNPVAELDVDIVIDEGMDTPTVAAEQFTELVKIVPNLIQMPPEWGKVLITASSLRDKDKLLDIFEKMQAQPQIPPEMQQQIQEMQQALQQLTQENQELKLDKAGQQAEVQVKNAEVQAKGAEVELKRGELELRRGDQQIDRDKLKIEAFKAQTDRIQALKPEPQPQAA